MPGQPLHGKQANVLIQCTDVGKATVSGEWPVVVTWERRFRCYSSSPL